MFRHFQFNHLSKFAFGLLHRRQILLVLMFTLLHVALLQGITTSVGRILMLVHFALFLLWQPFVNTQSRIAPRQLVFMVLTLFIAAVWLSWWLMCLWLMLIAGLVGGRVFFYNRRATKAFYLAALAYLISMLLLYALPSVIPGGVAIETQISSLIRVGLPAMIVMMALLPEGIEADSAQEAIDLAYSVFIMLMLAVLALGTVSLMLLRQIDYASALMSTVFAMAAMLLIASWLWNPMAGFAGLGAVASRYMLSIGLPFEHWLHSLTELAQRESDPYRFLDEACRGMAEQLPWVVSCSWVTLDRADAADVGKGIKTEFRHGELTLILVTQQILPPVLVWHFNLVSQLVSRFYVEKIRDIQLREMAYMQAVHETGARVTHDVKNLLQSLNAMLYVVGDAGEKSEIRLQPLLRRQLPLIVQRLQQTLEKLRVPETTQYDTMAAGKWWHELYERYEGRDVKFESFGDLTCLLPSSLFTSAAENLLQNALGKRATEPGIAIAIKLDAEHASPILSVSDTGSPLPDDRAVDVGKRPVASENGLGIGLYQLSRVAMLANYELELSSNRPGEVRFTLKSRAGKGGD